MVMVKDTLGFEYAGDLQEASREEQTGTGTEKD